MKPSAQLAAAIQVLQQILNHHAPAQKALEAWGKEHRFAGSGDRNTIGHLVYDVLRNKATLGHIMGKESPRALVMALFATQWSTLPALITMLDEKAPHAPDQLTDLEIRSIEQADATLAEAPAHIRGNFPKWMTPYIAEAYGEANAVAIMAAQTTRAPVDIRANILKATREAVLAELSHINATPCAISPLGIRIAPAAGKLKTPHLEAEQTYHRGWFEVQDEGSQLVSLLCGARAGQQVLDLCAGGGGKTLALAAQMENSGTVYAYDADRLRLAGLYPRVERSGATNIVAIDPKKPAPLETLFSKMDLVVVDAPCTGTGTWRRKPDSKWRLSEKQLRQRMAEQREILVDAAQYVKTGGVLAYITCSMLPQENDMQIQAFLAERKEFTPKPFAQHLPKALYSQIAAGLGLNDTTASLSLLPNHTHTDGFFIALLQKH